jgi:hypothetical protein
VLTAAQYIACVMQCQYLTMKFLPIHIVRLYKRTGDIYLLPEKIHSLKYSSATAESTSMGVINTKSTNCCSKSLMWDESHFAQKLLLLLATTHTLE